MILQKSREVTNRLDSIKDGETLGKELVYGTQAIEYYADIQKQALQSIGWILSEEERKSVKNEIERYCKKIDEYGEVSVKQFNDTVREKAKEESLKIVKYRKEKGAWEREAEKIIPKRNYVGTITLMDIPHEEWVEVRSSPKSWSARNWPAASLWWCDGKRNLNEIKKLCELEAGAPVRNFDLINYYKFLKKHGFVEFMDSKK